VYEDKVIKVTVCGGVAGYQGGMDANKLIKTADESLLRAKRQGKNLVIYDGR
jgi:PleD family two-component response regulator